MWWAGWPPKMAIQVLVPGACAYVMAKGQRDFADVTKFMGLKREITLDYLGGKPKIICPLPPNIHTLTPRTYNCFLIWSQGLGRCEEGPRVGERISDYPGGASGITVVLENKSVSFKATELMVIYSSIYMRQILSIWYVSP